MIAPLAPQLEAEAARRGWTVERATYGIRLVKDGSILIVGTGPASEAEALRRIAAVDAFARRWRR
jgi:hypothetical protein